MGRISFGAARFVAYSKMQNFKIFIRSFYFTTFLDFTLLQILIFTKLIFLA